MIGSGKDIMYVDMRTKHMINQIRAQENRLGSIKMIISNFQKKGNWIITSVHSIIELDIEVNKVLK